MIGAIANPTKSIVVDFPINTIRTAVKNIHRVMQFCHPRENNDMFNYYKFSRSEFLSMGAFININLTELGENKTQINIEISRTMGAFDEWIEVQKANKHITETINAISYIIRNGVPVSKPQPTEQKSQSGVADALATIVGLIIGIVGFFWILSLFNN